jgi:hypothetical protein
MCPNVIKYACIHTFICAKNAYTILNTYIQYTLYNHFYLLLGEWKDGKRNGKGTLTRLNGDVYEGNFSADQKNGHGIMRYAASGDVFEG